MDDGTSFFPRLPRETTNRATGEANKPFFPTLATPDFGTKRATFSLKGKTKKEIIIPPPFALSSYIFLIPLPLPKCLGVWKPDLICSARTERCPRSLLPNSISMISAPSGTALFARDQFRDFIPQIERDRRIDVFPQVLSLFLCSSYECATNRCKFKMAYRKNDFCNQSAANQYTYLSPKNIRLDVPHFPQKSKENRLFFPRFFYAGQLAHVPQKEPQKRIYSPIDRRSFSLPRKEGEICYLRYDEFVIINSTPEKEREASVGLRSILARFTKNIRRLLPLHGQN